MTHRSKPPANDNASANRRRIVSEIPEALPIFEAELALFESHFATMIEAMRRDAANDNGADAPVEETKP